MCHIFSSSSTWQNHTIPHHIYHEDKIKNMMVSPNHEAMKRKRARYASSLYVAIEIVVFSFLLLSVSIASSFSITLHRHGHHHLQHSQASYCNSSGRTTKLHMSNEEANPEEGSVLGASLLFAGEWR